MRTLERGRGKMEGAQNMPFSLSAFLISCLLDLLLILVYHAIKSCFCIISLLLGPSRMELFLVGSLVRLHTAL